MLEKREGSVKPNFVAAHYCFYPYKLSGYNKHHTILQLQAALKTALANISADQPMVANAHKPLTVYPQLNPPNSHP
jgi:hypothetical protein